MDAMLRVFEKEFKAYLLPEHTHTHTYIHTHTQKHTCTHIHKNTHTHTYTETHIHTHTQKHTYTHNTPHKVQDVIRSSGIIKGRR